MVMVSYHISRKVTKTKTLWVTHTFMSNGIKYFWVLFW